MLHPLPTEVVQKLRSGIAITSVSHCVNELVINAIDAGATCIAVRLNLPFYKMQVIDNGNGIDKDQMEYVGVRYATSKCHSIDDLHNLKSGGFRGESLASLKDMSSVLMIESRAQHSEDTYCKIFTHGRPPEIQRAYTDRPSKGTTVTIHNFMYNMPVRKQNISETLDLEDCRKSLEKLALIYPQISFSLRSDTTGEICLETKKCNSMKSAFRYLFGEERTLNLKELSLKKGPYDIAGFVSTEGHISKDLQLMYVNKRFVHRSKLQKLVSAILKKFLFSRQKVHSMKDNSRDFPFLGHSPSKSQARYAIFVLNVTCPYDEYDLILEPRRTLIEFTDWEKVLKVLEEAIFKFLKDNGHWSDKESLIELSTESNVIPNTSGSSHNFPSNLGKAICTQDNRNGLFSIPAKRTISNHVENNHTSPPKKLLLTHDINNVPIQQPSDCESEKNSSIITPVNSLNVPKRIKNVVSKPNSKPQPSLSFLNIPETGICLKEISRILNRQSNEKSEERSKGILLKAKLVNQTNAFTRLRNFEFNARKQPLNLEVGKKHEATQTEKHVSINPMVKKLHEAKNVSKYNFDDVSYLEPLKHIKHRKSNVLKSNLRNQDSQRQQNQSNKIIDPHPTLKKSANQSRAFDHKHKVKKISDDLLVRKRNHETKERVHEDMEEGHQFLGKKCMYQNTGPKNNKNRNVKSVGNDRVYDISHMQDSNRILREHDKIRYQQLSSKNYTSTVRISSPVLLLRNHDRFKSLGKKFRSHGRNTIYRTKDDLELECKNRSSRSRTLEVKKQPAKTLFINSLSYYADPKERSRSTSPPFSFFSKCNLDALRDKGRAILSSPSVECEFSRHGNIIGLKTPAKGKSLDSASETYLFQSPDCINLEDEHLNDESMRDLSPPLGYEDSVFPNYGNYRKPFDGEKCCATDLKEATERSYLTLPFSQIPRSPSPEIQNDSIVSKGKSVIWKEVPDSPPSPFKDDKASPEFDFNPSPDQRTAFDKKSSHNSVVLLADNKHSEQSHIWLTTHDSLENAGLTPNVQNEVNGAANHPNDQISTISLVIDLMDEIANDVEKSNCYKVETANTFKHHVSQIQSNLLPAVAVAESLSISGNSFGKDADTTVHTNSHRIAKSDRVIDNTMCIEKIPPALTLDTPLESMDHTNLKESGEISCDPSENQSLPRPAEHTSIPAKDIKINDSFVKCNLQSHIDKQEESNLLVKWKEPQMNISDNVVEDLFSSWENPMFQRPAMEVESINSTAVAQNRMTMYGILNSYRFSKKAFTSLQVIGQVDQKFIACLVQDVNEDFGSKKLLVLFDQHAVHERIRVEELIADFYETDKFGNKEALSTLLSSPLDIELNPKESRLVKAYSEHLKRMGITVSQAATESTFQIHSVPGCLLERANNELKRNRTLAIASLVENIICEWVILLEQTKNPNTVLPKTLTGILNSQACHGAIKFGDPLDRVQCTNLLETLSTCSLPFQCAHGRPSLTPLLDLQKIDVCRKKSPPQLKKLSRLMKESQLSVSK